MGKHDITYDLYNGISWSEKFIREGGGSLAIWGVYSVAKMYNNNKVNFKGEDPVFIGISIFSLALSLRGFINRSCLNPSKNDSNCAHYTKKALDNFEAFFRVGCGSMALWGNYSIAQMYVNKYSSTKKSSGATTLDFVVGSINMVFLAVGIMKYISTYLLPQRPRDNSSCVYQLRNNLNAPENKKMKLQTNNTDTSAPCNLASALSWTEESLRVGGGTMDIWAFYSIIKILNSDEELSPHSDQIAGAFALLMECVSILKFINEYCISRNDTNLYFKSLWAGLHNPEKTEAEETHRPLLMLAG